MAVDNLISTQLIQEQVKLALQEDVGQQDLTADLIPRDTIATAQIISRENATLCGKKWLEAVFSQIDSGIKINWFYSDGEDLRENDVICSLSGSARSLLTGERTAMNFVQTLSATASLSKRYADLVSDLDVQVLDTRKTIPGLRLAQKYAVLCGGGYNHRIGLYDGILIKENHINASGSISAAISQARTLHPEISIEVEVENFEELEQALAAKADIILLDNFDVPALRKAVEITQGQAQLEASGGITLASIRKIAETGVDRISIGALTKDVQAIDLSMRFV